MPGLYFIRYSGGKCRLLRFPLPDSAWTTAPPAVVLSVFADAAASPDAAQFVTAAPPDLYGAALYGEAWMTTAVKGTPEGDAILARARAGVRVSQMASRVEARTMGAVDRAGTGYQVLRPRGGKVETAVWHPGDDGSGAFLTGAVPRALDKIVTALLGVPLPERPRDFW
jgi:hypothetical protein